ncbi:MAG: 2-dehydro-3-deoxy-6-phosphogalactonate aldolase, partial [Povalibacter sp.]
MQPDSALTNLPLVAILRGLLPSRAIDVGNVIVAAGLRCIEVPLNSPDPFASI